MVMILTLQLSLLKTGKPTYIEPVDNFPDSVVFGITARTVEELRVSFAQPLA
jgi:hypothetical protein